MLVPRFVSDSRFRQQVETVRIAPGATEVTPLEFVHYPISHSLLGVLVAWAYWVDRHRWAAGR
jgi:hypothetical protein